MERTIIAKAEFPKSGVLVLWTQKGRVHTVRASQAGRSVKPTLITRDRENALQRYLELCQAYAAN